MNNLEIKYFEKLVKTVDSCITVKHTESMVCYVEYICENNFFSYEYQTAVINKVKEKLIELKNKNKIKNYEL